MPSHFLRRSCSWVSHATSHRRRRAAVVRARSEVDELETRLVLSSINPLVTDANPAASHTLKAPSHDDLMRIVNGTTTTDYPAVGLVNGGCTGTLISSTHVLTAGHCVENSSGGGFIGDTAGTFVVDGQTYRTNDVTPHPQYNPNLWYVGYDVAIMQLDRAVSGVSPMQILRQAPQVGQMLTLVGFGEGGTNQNPVYDFGTKREGFTPIDAVTNAHISWTFDNSNESNTAPGDSGGPAFVTSGSELYIAGVTSGGDNNSHALGGESFDTRIDVHAVWIDSVVGNEEPPPPPPPTDDDHVNQPGNDATTLILNSSGNAADTGILEVAGDRDVFQVTIPANGTLQINLNETDGSLDTYLRTYNSSGAQIAENDDGGTNFNSALSLTVNAGVYYLDAGAYGDSGSGEYRIEVQFTPANDPPPPPPPPPPSDDDHADQPGADATPLIPDGNGHASDTGILETSGDRDVFAIDLSAPGSLVVDLSETDGSLDTYLRVYSASGALIAEDDDGGSSFNSSLTLLLGPGLYFIDAGAYADSGTGSYRVDVQFTADDEPDPPPPPPPPPGDANVFYLSTANSGTVFIPDGSAVSFDDSDILKVTFDSTGQPTYSVYFDGSDVGLNNNGEDIDAFTALADGSLLISTSGSARVPGATAERQDLLRFVPNSLGETTSGRWEMYLDGSRVGLTERSENIDGVAVLSDGRLVLSTAGRFSVAGANGRDEDLLVYDQGTFEIYFDGSDVGLRDRSEDIDGVSVDAEGALHMSTRGDFNVPNVGGDRSDIFAFVPSQLGRRTQGDYRSDLTLDGRASGLSGLNVDAFHLGNLQPANRNSSFQASSDPGYQIDIEFSGISLPSNLEAVFQSTIAAAAEQWSTVIIGDVPDVFVRGQFVDDLVIHVSVNKLDGPGGVLGQAGPTELRSSSFLPSMGIMEFDAADVANLHAAGELMDVVLHEMGHVIGIGTIWDDLDLVQWSDGSATFVGAAATAEYSTRYGESNGVPVETVGGAQTAGGHWDRDALRDELMVGYLRHGNARLSGVTVAALADMGYAINPDAADSLSSQDSSDVAMTSVVPGHAAVDRQSSMRPFSVFHDIHETQHGEDRRIMTALSVSPLTPISGGLEESMLAASSTEAFAGSSLTRPSAIEDSGTLDAMALDSIFVDLDSLTDLL
ncbi:MAG: trypsin-like serine protease [Fuerstiella sp.]